MIPYKVPSSSAKGAVLSFLDVTALHEVSRLQNIIDALAPHIAVLDSRGVITLVNKAWARFSAENGDPNMRRTGPGIDYLDVCRDDSGNAAQRGVRDVLEGKIPHFSLEYPCHSPTEERWFVMHVSPLDGDTPGAVVSHVNITDWRNQRAASTT
jgi:two-component system CheB/CheR fusion protein